MSQESDDSPRKKPWWLFPGSRRAAYALAGLWLIISAFAMAQLILTDTAGVRWASAGQLTAALVLTGSYLRSARYNGPREVRPSTSRWGAGRPDERWH
jgi:hypothetical protein